MANFGDTASAAVQDAGRNGRESSGELARSAESAAVSAADKIVREASADGRLDSSEKSEAKRAAEQAAKDKVASKTAEAANQAAPGEVTVKQGDTVWGSLRAAGYSDQEITGQGLVDKVAQASGLQNADQIQPGDVLKIPGRDGGTPANGPDRRISAQDIGADGKLRDAVAAAAAEAGLPADAVPGVNSSAQSELVPGSNDRRNGTLTLRDPSTGEVLGTYEFNNGGFGKGSIPNGTYEVDNARVRDKAGMVVDGVGFSFDLTQQGMASGTANDPRYSAVRDDLRIHPDGRGAGTEGCIGIVGGADVQRDFWENARALMEANGGSFTLEFA